MPSLLLVVTFVSCTDGAAAVDKDNAVDSVSVAAAVREQPAVV